MTTRFAAAGVLAMTVVLIAAGGALADATTPLAVCFAIDTSNSNWEAGPDGPASDPGPPYTRSNLVDLFAAIAGSGIVDRQTLVGFDTYGGDIAATGSLVDVRDQAARDRLDAAISAGLVHGGWTSTVRGIDGCAGVLSQAPAGARRAIVLLSDGVPEGPDGDAAAQVRTLQSSLSKLRSGGITTSAVVYGTSAASDTEPVQTMRQIAEAGGGTLYRAPRGIDLVELATALVHDLLGLPLSGREAPVGGLTSIPLAVPADASRVVFVVVRSSISLTVAISDPTGADVDATPSSQPGAAGSAFSLTLAVDQPSAGVYTVTATGEGTVYAAELLSLRPVQVTPTPGRTLTPPQRRGTARALPAAGVGLGLGLLALLVLGAAIAVRRRILRARPHGLLVVWLGETYAPWHLQDVPDVRHAAGMPLSRLLPGPSDLADGWIVRYRNAPRLDRLDSEPVLLQPDITRELPLERPATITWHPEDADPHDVAERDRPQPASA